MQDKTIIILQSNYLPWKGYFDLIASADTFVVFDDVQYTRRDWRNRNYIVHGGRKVLLTIPVATKGKYNAKISEIEISDPAWTRKHWGTIRQAYAKAPYFSEYEDALEAAYKEAEGITHLSTVNCRFLSLLMGFLDIDTRMANSADVPHGAETPTDRLIEICCAHEATRYVSGPAAKAYIEADKFHQSGIELRYADYSGYPDYDQRSDEFDHHVSMLDLLMNCGPAARNHLKSCAPGKTILAEPD